GHWRTGKSERLKVGIPLREKRQRKTVLVGEPVIDLEQTLITVQPVCWRADVEIAAEVGHGRYVHDILCNLHAVSHNRRPLGIRENLTRAGCAFHAPETKVRRE